MKRVFLTLFFCVAASVCCAYDKRVVHVIEQLRDLQEVGSDAVGYAGTPHDFYSLYRYCWYASTDKDLVEMLHDRSPVVRLMGAKCIVTSPYRHIDHALLRPLRGDATKIMVGPGGCVFQQMTVGDVVGEMVRDPDYLGPREPRRPNRSPGQTTPGMTAPASSAAKPTEDRAQKSRN